MTPFVYAALGRWPGRRPPILLTEHGRFFPDRPSRQRAAFNRLLLRRGDRIVAVGECVKRALVANEGLPAERIAVILNGVDLESASRHAQERAAARAELGADEGTVIVLAVARLDPIKNHAMLVRAFAAGLRDRPALLAVVGDGPERAALAAAVAAAGVAPQTRLLGARRDVPRLLAAADAVALTSFSEGIPLALAEAMAAGLPVVATDVGGIPEVVAADETGLLVPTDDAAACAAALRRVADDAPLRRRLGAAGRRRAERLFDERQMLARYAALLAEMRP
jgi:glycosyltransferase involved in cell wall biosynthesis